MVMWKKGKNQGWKVRAPEKKMLSPPPKKK
jgi:hypothetical protein